MWDKLEFITRKPDEAEYDIVSNDEQARNGRRINAEMELLRSWAALDVECSALSQDKK